MTMTPFVDGWDFAQTLGEGAYGEVKLAVERVSGQELAVKIIDMNRNQSSQDNIKKEMLIAKLLNHVNVVRCFGHRKEGHMIYLFMEYASGGELFDKIEPDIGMEMVDAQRYFRELISGVEYMHSEGVVHRDIKPENLLLSSTNTLKITDFGFATKYRHNGVERVLATVCGTRPYVAPEVFANKPYRGPSIDVWSCGIVLTTLVAGELPWDEPSWECKEYGNWRKGGIFLSPWYKVDNMALSLIKKILTHDVEQRFTIEDIKKHPWFTKVFGNEQLKRIASPGASSAAAKKLRTERGSEIALSQPVPGNSYPHLPDPEHGVSFSQPNNLENLIVGSQLTPGSSSVPRLVRRMTRFFVVTGLDDTIKQLEQAMERFSYSVKKSTSGQMTISTMDKRKSQLVFKAFVISMGGNLLVDFRLSKGDGLEFKKCFTKIKDSLVSIIDKKAQAQMWAHLGMDAVNDAKTASPDDKNEDTDFESGHEDRVSRANEISQHPNASNEPATNNYPQENHPSEDVILKLTSAPF